MMKPKVDSYREVHSSHRSKSRIQEIECSPHPAVFLPHLFCKWISLLSIFLLGAEITLQANTHHSGKAFCSLVRAHLLHIQLFQLTSELERWDFGGPSWNCLLPYIWLMCRDFWACETLWGSTSCPSTKQLDYSCCQAWAMEGTWHRPLSQTYPPETQEWDNNKPKPLA